ncbi:hypothetical protein [Candidatus Williamhamiltonella defendens]|uniref:hypothetical protein n=1 Tax=Candidatus Williamhamiltonella defendens TaxID=138072 RepID=UPI0016519F1D|nr:hypothetical protein [Candidatus Hamiltonella defensa]
MNRDKKARKARENSPCCSEGENRADRKDNPVKITLVTISPLPMADMGARDEHRYNA